MTKGAWSPDGETVGETNVGWDQPKVSLEEAFTLASHRYRWEVLLHLQEHDNESEFDELVDALLGAETPAHGGRPDPEERQSVAIDLQHRHLPKLEEHGVISIVDDGDRIRYHGDPVVETLLNVIETVDP